MTYIHAAVVVLASAVSFTGAWQAQGWRMDAKLSQLKTEYAQAQAQAVEKAHAETIRMQSQKDDAERNAQVRQRALARAVAGVRHERDGLRDELAAARAALPDASCAAVREHAAALNSIFGECADRLEAMAGKAQGHAIDSLKLQEGWPK